jgi:transposase
MQYFLSSSEEKDLISQHRLEKNRRVADRIKAVLLANKGWTNLKIAQALLLDDETVARHIKQYKDTQKLQLNSGGSDSKLTEEQTSSLVTHLMDTVYTKVSEIIDHIQSTYGTTYTPSGMKCWLHSHKFSYKKPKGTPAKADLQAQAEWVESYEKLLNTLPEDEPVLFGDGVHPTMATKVSYGWIRKGTDKIISTTGNRSRLNLMGSIDLETMDVIIDDYDTINSSKMKLHFGDIRDQYSKAPKIHVILDRGSYNTSAETKKAAEDIGIVLHYLPPYSPNLNPIERLWKVMNEYVRNNRFFTSAKEFRQAILAFFKETWPSIAKKMTDRINDNFQRLESAL